MRATSLLFLFLILLPLACAANIHQIQVGSAGTTIIGETVSGGGPYFIGIGKTVNVARADVVALAIGEAVNVDNVKGDLYAMGKAINIQNVGGAAYVLAEQLVVTGNVNKLVAWAGSVVVEGNVEELNCDCGSVVVARGAHVNRLSGEAKKAEIEGTVGTNGLTIKPKEEKEESPLSKAKDWVTGLVSMLILAFVLKNHRKWRSEDLRNALTYIYGLVALAFPLVLLIVFIISLLFAELGTLFGVILGLEIAAFGVWLAALLVAGLPVYDILGGALLRKVGKENYYANVALGYTLCFLVSLVFPIWILVALVGLGLLVRCAYEQTHNSRRRKGRPSTADRRGR